MQAIDLFDDDGAGCYVALDRPISVVLKNLNKKFQFDSDKLGLIDGHQELVDTVFERAATALVRAHRCWDESDRKDGPFMAEHDGSRKAMFDAVIECMRLTNLGVRIFESLKECMFDINTLDDWKGHVQILPVDARLCRLIINRGESQMVKVIQLAVSAARESDTLSMNRLITQAENLKDRVDAYLEDVSPEAPLRVRLWSFARAFPLVTGTLVLALGAAAIYGIATI